MTHLTRRSFLAATGAVVLTADPAAAVRRPVLLRSGRFSEGVMSGDPSATAITLATRLVGAEGPGAVRVELALDRGFDKVVARSTLTTSPALGHAIKARITGLRPHREYYYRFAGRSAESRVGRFRTSLPPGSRQALSFGVFAGQDFTAGYFTAQGLLARQDVDFVLNMGNYIVADPVDDAPYNPRALPFDGPANALSEYRRRYRAYRTDADLRAMHANHALVSTWDDGEVRTGYAGTEIASVVRSGAYRAWFEAMPHYPKRAGLARVYYKPRFSDLLDLHLLDTRQHRTAAPSDRLTGLLGASQDRFLRGSLKDSRAAWKIIASPAPLSGEASQGWTGFPSEREQLLATLSQRGVEDALFLSAGRRRFIAENVLDAHGVPVAPEFGCGSVSQTSDEASDTDDPSASHGYAVVSVTPDLLTVRYDTLASVSTRDRTAGPRLVYEIERGQGTLS